MPLEPASLDANLVTVAKGGVPLAGTLSLASLDPTPEQPLTQHVLLWTPDDPAAYQGELTVRLWPGLADLAGRVLSVPLGERRFVVSGQGDVLWAAPPDAPPRSASQVGNDRFLHGRPWLARLELYDFRARFFDPATATFLTPDLLGPIDSPNLYQAFGLDPLNTTDPFGECLFGLGGTCAQWAEKIEGEFERGKEAVRANVGGGVLGVVADATVSTVLDVVETFVVDPLRVGEATGEAIGTGAGAGETALALVQDAGRAIAFGGGGSAAALRYARALRQPTMFDDLGDAVTRGLDDAAREMAGGSRGGASGAGAVRNVQPGAPKRGVGANRAAGNASRDFIAEREAPALIEQNLRTTGGLRRLDVLKKGSELIGIESKAGRTGLTARVRQELARDVKLLPLGKLDQVRWEFWKSARTGQGGPSAALRQKLEKFGIEIVEHDNPF